MGFSALGGIFQQGWGGTPEPPASPDPKRKSLNTPMWSSSL